MADFRISSVEQLTPNTFKVFFTETPLRTSSSGFNDALNIQNYVISGPGSANIEGIDYVPDTSKEFYLYTTNSLNVGTWTLTASNIVKFDGSVSIDTTPVEFKTKGTNQLPPVSLGAENDSSESTIRKAFNPAFVGKNWAALINALGTADAYIKNLARRAFDQLFTITAEGKYLDRIGAENGFERPFGVGISDDVFRQLIIKITAEKVTIQSILNVLEVFYGPDALRATSDSLIETFDLNDGDDLLLEIDGKNVVIFFKTEDFTNINSATALECCAVINRFLSFNKLSAFAKPVKDITTNLNKIRILSGALGLRGNIKVNGGRAQNKFKFPTFIETTQTIGTQWDVDTPASLNTLNADTVRFTWVGGTDPSLDLLEVGDYVNIYGNVFDSNNQGAYFIKEVTDTYFEVSNLNGSPQLTVTQTAADDLLFFTPTRRTLNSNSRFSFAAQGNVNYADVFLAATTQAVNRRAFTAAYLHNTNPISLVGSSTVSTFSRTSNVITLNTSTAHGLNIGDRFYFSFNPTINFQGGVYTVASTPSATQITFNSVGSNFSSSGGTIFPCFRDSLGEVTLKTTSNHGLTNNQWAFIDNLQPNVGFNRNIYGLPVSDVFGVTLEQPCIQLSNGNVFCSGGFSGGSWVATSSMYNVETGSWAATGNMNTARRGHVLIQLSDNEVMAIGGNTTGGTVLTSCEIYDISQDTWAPTTNLNTARQYCQAIKLNNGKIFIFGGTNSNSNGEIFDPALGTWTNTSSSGTSRFNFGMVKLPNGLVFIAGGDNLNSCQMYNPFNDSWQTLDSMAIKRQNNTNAYIFINKGASGSIMAIAGRDETPVAISDVEIYDIATNTWTTVSSLPDVIADPGVCIAPNGDIIAFGTNGLNEFPKLYYYNILTDTWNTVPTGNFTGVLSFGWSFIFKYQNKLITNSRTAPNSGGVFYWNNTPVCAGGQNGLFQLTVNSTTSVSYSTTYSSSFTYETPFEVEFEDNLNQTINALIYPVKAIEDENHIGPYLWNPDSGPGILSDYTTLTQNIVKNQSYSIITVANASDFPSNGGWIVFDFGYENQLFPVRYLLKISSTQLLLDSSYKFPIDIPSGTGINLLITRGIWVPTFPQRLGSFYITDSIAGRLAASNLITQIQAAGLTVNQTVLYPGSFGLGGWGYPLTGTGKLNDIVYIYGSQESLDEARLE